MLPPPDTPDPLDDYITHLRAAGAAPRTIRLRLDHARQLATLQPRLEEITARDIEAWMQPRARHYSAETLKSRRSSARRFFGWLHETGALPANPTGQLHPVRIPPAPPRVIPDSDMRRAILRASRQETAAILLARYACLRLTELTTLRTEHRRDDALRIVGKGGRVRIVYLHPDLQHALDVLEEEQGPGWYFPGHGTAAHMHPQSMHKVIKRVTGWNPHALRHAGATAAYRATRDLRSVQLMLGHSSLATTQRYLQLDEDAQRALALGVEVRAA